MPEESSKVSAVCAAFKTNSPQPRVWRLAKHLLEYFSGAEGLLRKKEGDFTAALSQNISPTANASSSSPSHRMTTQVTHPECRVLWKASV